MQAWAAMGLADGHTWAVFVMATAVLNATPGVDLLLVVSRTLQGGARAGCAAALGIGAGCAVHALAAALGLAAVLAVSAVWFSALKIGGIAYLLWTAWGLWAVALAREPLPTVSTEGGVSGGEIRPERSGGWAEFRRGLLTNVLNPKVALFFLAFVPQFIAPDVHHKTAAFLVLGAAFVLQGTLFLWLVAAAVSHLRGLALPHIWQRGLHGVAGSMFVIFAWRLWSFKEAS